MIRFSDLVERARALVFAGRRRREMEEELRFHVDCEAEERVRRGEDPAAARRAARAALGSFEKVKEDVSDASGVRPFQDLLSDLRYALRSLGRDPIYAAAAVAVLGVGLGAGATVFGVWDSVLVSPLPYRDPDRLVRVGQLYQGQPSIWQLSSVDALAILEQQRSFESFGLFTPGGAALSGAGTPERVAVGRVTAGFLRALGVDAAAGRLIAPGDEAPDAPPVAVVSYRLADERLGGAAQALGRSLTLDGVGHTVVGVLPRGTDDLAGHRAPVFSVLKLRPPERRGPFWLRGVGRLGEGVSLEAAARHMAAIGERIFPLWAASFQDRTARITPVLLRDTIVGDTGRALSLFGAAVALVLLVAIVNVTTLALVRASAREPELAIRATLGAGRLRLARLPLVEGLLLGAVAGLVGLGLATLGLHSLARWAPNLPRLHEVAMSGRTAAFTFALGLLNGALLSVSPVLLALRGAAHASPHRERRRTGADRRTTAFRSALVVSEFALALPLLLGAGLLLRSLVLLQSVDPGFNPSGAVSVRVNLPAVRYPGDAERLRFWRQLEARALEIPGVSAAGVATELPPDEPGDVNNFNLIDRPVAAGVAEHLSPWCVVTPGYFEALGIPLLEGRMFRDTDTGDAPPVVLVSRFWAEKYYPGESAVGRRMVAGGCTTCPPTTVVGVVGDVKYLGLAEAGDAVYAPLAQAQPRTAHVLVRTRTVPATAFQALRDVVRGIDVELPVVEETLAGRIDAALLAPARSTAVLGSFAAVAVVLAALGIFGLMSYSVRQRRREIGVRIALGADPAGIMWMIVGSGLRHAALGSAMGLGLAALEARWLQAFLFGVAATDPPTIAAVTLAVLGVAGLACWLPGLRAARIHPAQAIAAE
jgi:predicted permease